jgi:hypothetical protein
VQWAYANGRLAVTNGTGNACVLEELTGEKVAPYRYCIGMVADGLLTMSAKEDRVPTRFFVKGERVEMESRDFLKTLERGRRGDQRRQCGGLGRERRCPGRQRDRRHYRALLGIACVRGIPLIVPVGLEKLILGR